MLSRDKMFIVASNLDDSKNSHTVVYDISLFKSLADFEKYIDKLPVVIDTLVLTSTELPFSNSGMTRMLSMLDSKFIKIKSSIIYLIDMSYDYKVVSKFFKDNGLNNWAVYQGDLSKKFVVDIISGEGRESNEGQVELVTYRYRLNDYVRQQENLKYETDSEKYYTDEDELAGIPDIEVPVSVIPSVNQTVKVDYVAGDVNSKARSVFAFLLAQYRALSGKTLIVEHDPKYHMLTEMYTKSGIAAEYIEMGTLMQDISFSITRIRESQSNLIVIGLQKNTRYDYDFIVELLEANLSDNLAYIVRECDYSEITSGMKCMIVTENTVPEILKCSSSINCAIDEKDVTFVGIQFGSLGQMDVISGEMQFILCNVLSKNNINAQVFKIDGIVLKGDKTIYDILSVISGEDR